MSRQQRDGSWKCVRRHCDGADPARRQEAIEGIFNNKCVRVMGAKTDQASCAIAYPSYKHTFSIMALGRACVSAHARAVI